MSGEDPKAQSRRAYAARHQAAERQRAQTPPPAPSPQNLLHLADKLKNRLRSARQLPRHLAHQVVDTVMRLAKTQPSAPKTPSTPLAVEEVAGRPDEKDAPRWRLSAHQKNQLALPSRPKAAPAQILAIVVSKNRGESLAALFDSALDHNTYTHLSWVVIDLASTDQTRTILEGYQQRLPITVVRANSERWAPEVLKVAQTSQADQLLFLAPEIILADDIFASLSRYLEDPRIGAVAPQLRYPPLNLAHPSGLASAGLKFHLDAETRLFRPYHLSADAGLNQPGAVPERMPALSGAFLLCRRHQFLAVGGFSDDYLEGCAAPDFCLALRRLGLNTVSALELKALYDIPEEHTELRVDLSTFDRKNGWTIRRANRQDKLRGDHFWSDRPLALALVPAPGPEGHQAAFQLQAALLAAYGWETKILAAPSDPYDADDADILLCLDPEYEPKRIHRRRPTLLLVAWVVRDPEVWKKSLGLDDWDIFLAADARLGEFLGRECSRGARLVEKSGDPAANARQLLTALEDFHARYYRIGLKVPTPSHAKKHEWGDYHLALALQRALRRRGHAVRMDILPEWKLPRTLSDDVALVLRGLEAYAPDPKQINLIWNISHPEKVTREEYESYDHVFVASEPYAAQLGSLRVPVSPLLQCTDPDLFYPDESAILPKEPVLFVGNSRKQRRPIIMDAIEAGVPLAVYGKLWEGLIDPGFVMGTHVPNEILRQYYSNAGIVLNDHWPQMRDLGFVSNRLFDAAACGALIISDPAAGLTEVFGEQVLTYETPAELRALVDQYLDDPAARQQLTRGLAEKVRREHTFEQRADAFLRVIEALAQKRDQGLL